MLLTKTPVKDPIELQKVLSGLPDAPFSYSIAVEALIFSTDGKLLLHKRGKGCRDEIGKREGIGGGFEESDENFLNALNREIKEEVGQDAQIEVDSFFEIRKDTVRDVKANQEQHRIIISYLCTYIGGELKIMEPHKNEGFSFVDIHTVEEKTLSSSAFSALQSLKKNQLSTYDPSKYAVYQMAEYALQDSGKKLIQQAFSKMLLLKIEPFQDDLYNYAYVFSTELSEAEHMQIKEFFGKQTFRITFSKNIHMNNFLLKHGYYWKDNGHIMLQTKKIDTFSFDLPDNVVMSPVNNLITLQHYKEIFSTAFQKTLEQTEQKFGFYDTILINPEDSHINAFVLYEDGKPVAIGAYYAFDTFSVENIGTLPEARGKGYAQIIVKKLLQEAKKLGYTQAALVASEMGAPVYTKLGFTTLHETTTFISPTSEEKNIAS